MEKTEFDIPMNPDHKKDTIELINALKKNSQIAQLVSNGDIDASCIEQYPWKLKEWLKEIQPCVNCKGLKQCRQMHQGYYYAVHFDGILSTSQRACRYQRDLLKRQQHLSQYLVNDLPMTMRETSLTNIDPRHESSEYVSLYMELSKDSEEDASVYLCGTMGAGKTYLASCACNDHARMHQKVAFIHYPTFCARMQEQIKNSEYRSEITKLMYAKFLVIDDIGAENVNEWNRDTILLPLLNHRYENQLATWFTSNCDLEALKMHLCFSRTKEDELKAERVIERIRAMGKTKTLTGRDRRSSR